MRQLFQTRLHFIQIDSCDVEPFEGMGNIQDHVERLTVHHSVHLLKVSQTRRKPMDASSFSSQQKHNNITEK